MPRRRYILLCLGRMFYRYLLYAFKLYHLSIFWSGRLSSGGSEVFKSPTISVWGLVCDLSFCNASFANVGALVFEA